MKDTEYEWEKKEMKGEEEADQNSLELKLLEQNKSEEGAWRTQEKDSQ